MFIDVPDKPFFLSFFFTMLDNFTSLSGFSLFHCQRTHSGEGGMGGE